MTVSGRVKDCLNSSISLSLERRFCDLDCLRIVVKLFIVCNPFLGIILANSSFVIYLGIWMMVGVVSVFASINRAFVDTPSWDKSMA